MTFIYPEVLRYETRIAAQTEDPELACALELGCTSQEVCNFVVGFDGAELLSPDWKDDEYYYLGRKLRQQMDGGQ